MPESIDTPATPEAIFGKDAVAAALADHAAIQGLQQFITDAKWDRGELTLTVAPETIIQTCEAAKAAGYNFFEDLTGGRLVSGRAAVSTELFPALARLKQRIRIVARLEGDTPTIDSITGVWPAANFYEREVFDLFGVTFAGHPRLTRIMMPDNWNGHPLRKDYPVEGYR